VSKQDKEEQPIVLPDIPERVLSDGGAIWSAVGRWRRAFKEKEILAAATELDGVIAAEMRIYAAEAVRQDRLARRDGEVESAEKPAEKPAEEQTKPVEAEYTGGSVSYYRVQIALPTTVGTEPYVAECNDVIEALDMNYAEGNAFKALWRRAAARKGKAKRGYTDGLYDAEKVVFFGQRLVDREKGAAK
jgi:hypothetical protein